jgi:hypothetical protein
MRRHPLRVLRAAAMGGAAALLPLLGSSLSVSSCGSTANPAAAGGECFLATDCAPGLVCVAQENGTRTCTNDLSNVAGKPPPEGGAPDAGRDGAGREGGRDATPSETGAPDTGGGGPPDTGPG